MIDRFEAKFVKEPGCWLWLAGCQPNGYGKIQFCGRTLLAHRVSYELYRGPIPAGLCVLHKCDVRPCVNPAHLFLGTHAENSADMASKGRSVRQIGDANGSRTHPERVPRGEKHVRAKLTEKDVQAIRASALSQRELAGIYGMSQAAISRVRSRERWRHTA